MRKMLVAELCGAKVECMTLPDLGGDGTTGGVRAGKPTKKNWPNKVTRSHHNHSMLRMQQDYLAQADVCIVHEEISC